MKRAIKSNAFSIREAWVEKPTLFFFFEGVKSIPATRSKEENPPEI
jgi:hypothetical protein